MLLNPSDPAIDDSPHHDCQLLNGHEGDHAHDVVSDSGRTVVTVFWSALDEGAYLA